MPDHDASPPIADGSPRDLAVLGSTGSIGTQTLEIARLFPERFRVRVLTAHRNADLLAEQARASRPDAVVIGDADRREALAAALSDTDVTVRSGAEALRGAASRPDVDVTVAAVVGFAGLRPVLAALRAGKTVALANKETMVVGGALVNETLAHNEDAALIPVDSEHSAIYQCLAGESAEAVEELILTASGGPFRERPAGSFDGITKAEALDHPNWSMGEKITIDSATMMNKGLEVIEARWLFGVDPENIRVMVHPQSIVHSMVAFRDGSVKAQLGVPDMKVPIQYALSHPARWQAPHERLDWSELSRLDFEPPDTAKFPCLRLAFEALRTGGTAPAALNAANEAAVALFLQERIGFTDLPALIEDALARADSPAASPSLEALTEADRAARRRVRERAASPVD
jgi:1-deoxy-D-xylulose-5-phosphate reductoisomerase